MIQRAPDLREMLHQAQHSLAAAITCLEEDVEAAVDDLSASSFLIATVLMALEQRGAPGHAAPRAVED